MIQKLFNNRVVYLLLFSSASCSLNCKYCYIPKTEEMEILNRKIIERLNKKELIEDIKKVYGNNLRHLGLFGAEIILNTKDLSKIIPIFLKKFPKLEKISLSTSLLIEPNRSLELINAIAKEKKETTLRYQISLDGPAFITDKNRKIGAAKKIPENLFYIIRELNKLNLKKINIEFHFKATFTIENIRLLNRQPILIKKYFDYFESISKQYKKESRNKNTTLFLDSTPTLTLPGRYTTENGKNLSIFFKNLRILAKENNKKHYWKHVEKSLNNYTYRFSKLLDRKDELFTKPFIFTCTGGDESFGLGTKGNLQICHRTFFFEDEKYINDVLSQKDIENWDISHFKKGRINLINKMFVANVNNKRSLSRFAYVLRNYHDFTKAKNSYIIAMVKELALAGQADKRYLEDDNLCMMFALFINSAFSCPAENLLNTGVIHFAPISIIRLLANGAFNEILKDYYENISTRK